MPRLEELADVQSLSSVFAETSQLFAAADYEPPLSEFMTTLEEEHFAFFANEQSPGGDKWPALQPSTISRKGHDTILFETGALANSLTQPGAGIREVSSVGLLFGTDVPYSGFHMDGTKHLPKREHVGMNEASLDVLTHDVADHAVKSLTPEGLRTS